MSVSHEADVKPRRSQLVAEFLRAAVGFCEPVQAGASMPLQNQGTQRTAWLEAREPALGAVTAVPGAQVPGMSCERGSTERAQRQATLNTGAWGHAGAWAVPSVRDAERGPSGGRRRQPVGEAEPLAVPQLRAEEGAGALETD